MRITPGAEAQQKTLSILCWSHFVPAYDKWFDNEYTKQWGEKNDTEVIVDHVGIPAINSRAAAEVSAAPPLWRVGMEIRFRDDDGERLRRDRERASTCSRTVPATRRCRATPPAPPCTRTRSPARTPARSALREAW